MDPIKTQTCVRFSNRKTNSLVAYACDPSPGEAETGGSWGSWSVSVPYMVSSRSEGDFVSQSKQKVHTEPENLILNCLRRVPWLLGMCMCVCMCARVGGHTHTHTSTVVLFLALNIQPPSPGTPIGYEDLKVQQPQNLEGFNPFKNVGKC